MASELDNWQKLADKLCKKEACKIQASLHGSQSVILLVSKYHYLIFCISYFLSAHNYQEEFCTNEIKTLRQCCLKLIPEVLSLSVHCSGFRGKFSS